MSRQKTTTIWGATEPEQSFGRHGFPIHADVAIVGAGITGLTAAVLLKQRGKRVAVIEKATIAAGESGRTTAHITEAVDARYYPIERSFGTDVARQVAAASRAAMDLIARFIGTFNIPCHFERVPGYLYTETRSAVAGLKREAAAAAKAGVAARFVDDVPLPFLTRGAVLFADQAQFHPREYLYGLAKTIPGDGSSILEGTHVVDIQEGEPCVLETSKGQLTADAVFQATHVPLVGFASIHMKAVQYRTYALAFRAGEDHPKGLFWDTSDPYHYIRWQRTGAGTFMIVGGADHKTGQKRATEHALESLRGYSGIHFGISDEIYGWSGQVVEPADGLPYIGGAGKSYVSTGYAGQGMTFGTLGGMIVADLIAGQPNPWTSLFDPNRLKPEAAGRDLAAENVDYPSHLVADRVLSADVEATRLFDVKSGEAKIVALGGRKVAVYRDETGAIHAISPVCTHMKCDVAWNAAEATWDCPCHGSRYSVDGAVLNGPAHVGLERVDLGEVALGEEKWRRERDSNPR